MSTVYFLKADDSNADEIRELMREETASFRKELKAFGYDADLCLICKGKLELSVSADGSRNFQPKIYINQSKGKTSFKIQTTSYGALDYSSFDEFVESNRLARKAVAFLVGYDYSKLPAIEYEE